MNTQKYNSTRRNEALDEFLTPEGLIEACFRKAIVPLGTPDRILDVGANDGRWGKIARKYFPEAFIMGVELMDMPRPDEFDDWVNTDFIAWKNKSNFDLIIGNPPFTVRDEEGKVVYKAEDFVYKALNCLSPAGYIGFLLRTNFRHSQERHTGLLAEYHPKYIWETDRRPSFYRFDKRTKYFGGSNTNAHDYSFFIWEAGWKEKVGFSIPLVWNY